MKRFVVLDLVVTLSYRVEQRGAAASGEEKKNRDAVTSFYVYNRLCVWRVLYNTAIKLCFSLSLSLEFNQLRSASTRNGQVNINS